MVRNLSASQKHHKMDFFLALACNQSENFGISPIKNWIDGYDWHSNFDNCHCMTKNEKEEIKTALHESAASLLLRAWMEVRITFLEFLCGSSTSPCFPVECMFSRDEYQADQGNLPHAHLMVSLDHNKMNDAMENKINELIRASVSEIARTDEVEQ